MLSGQTTKAIVAAIYRIPELRGAVVGLYDGEQCMAISSGYPGAMYSSRLSVIVEIIGSDNDTEIDELEGRAEAPGAIASVAPPPAIVRNKSRMGAELLGAGWNCLLTGVAAAGVAAGVAAEVPTGGVSSFLVVASW